MELPGSGGGILNDVGGTLTLDNIFIEGNTANRAGGGLEDVSGNATVVTLTEVSLTSNNAGTNPGNGGGVHISGDGNIEITGGIVSNNMAIEGGGLWNNIGSMMVSDVYFEANIANGNDPDQGGGAIYNNGGALAVDSASYFTANVAAGISGSGGAIFNNTDGTVDIRNTTFVSNESNRAGGAIEDASGVIMALQIDSCLFELNDAGDNPGNGGAIHMTGMGDISVSNSYFDSNIAGGTGGALWNGAGVMTVEATGIIDNVAGTGAGGIYNTTGEVNVMNSTISRNMVSTVSGIGGGITNLPDGTVTVTSSTISENTSFKSGGAIYNEGTLEVMNSTLYNNQSDTLSGGIMQVGSTASINLTGSIVAGNSSASGFGDADLEGSVMGGGYNLIGIDHLNLFGSNNTNITGTLNSPVDPMLDTLTNNGGFTRTHSIICGSPAYNAGDPNDNSPDQRGLAVFGMRRDIGSFEYQDTCATISTTEPATRIEIENIYPNPVKNQMIIDLGILANNEEFDWTIIELSSGTIKMAGQTRANRLNLNVSNLAGGSYAIEFRNSEKIGIKRFIIIE
ncbi:MAG: choice-of-anchor Q domain-containing protein [Saprospiraceae bacterium]